MRQPVHHVPGVVSNVEVVGLNIRLVLLLVLHKSHGFRNKEIN